MDRLYLPGLNKKIAFEQPYWDKKEDEREAYIAKISVGTESDHNISCYEVL